MAQVLTKEEPQWANPGALGLAAFGLNTILLQVHNLGIMDGTMPLVYGLFWGGLLQLIAGLIDGKRGDTFGLTAFCSYGAFWLGLSSAFILQWMGFIKIDSAGLAWTCVMWGIFTAFMTIGTFKMTFVHFFIFATLTILFFLLAAHFFGNLSATVCGVEGIICGASAAYGAAAVIINGKFGRTILPMGRMLK
ncbi:MAG: acetate uptake transporter [Dehalococcoidales bacterium]|nr:acetate uptake transporter [Dehalococcoidales bacterium]